MKTGISEELAKTLAVAAAFVHHAFQEASKIGLSLESSNFR
jgi:hypothetical protein